MEKIKCLCGCGELINSIDKWGRKKRFKINHSGRYFGKMNKELGLSVGDKNPRWRGGRKKNYAGYIQIKDRSHPFCDANGYVMEHRIKIEKKIGRFLEKKEQVHHINGIKNDNRIKNLKLFRSASDHRKEHWKDMEYRKWFSEDARKRSYLRKRNEFGDFI